MVYHKLMSNIEETYTPASDLITKARVEEIVKKHSFLAAGLGIVPVPLLTLFLLQPYR